MLKNNKNKCKNMKIKQSFMRHELHFAWSHCFLCMNASQIKLKRLFIIVASEKDLTYLIWQALEPHPVLLLLKRQGLETPGTKLDCSVCQHFFQRHFGSAWRISFSLLQAVNIKLGLCCNLQSKLHVLVHPHIAANILKIVQFGNMK